LSWYYYYILVGYLIDYMVFLLGRITLLERNDKYLDDMGDGGGWSWKLNKLLAINILQ
jgi:hypothetical protein